MLLPFTYPWIIKRHLANNKKILDVGCGNGTFMAKVNEAGEFNVVGIDLFEPYLEEARKTGVYKNIIKGDIRNIGFRNGSYDLVHASQVIEHLKQKEGLSLIKKMEKIAKRKVIVGTPNGHFDQDEYDRNKLQRHQSAWKVSDFNKLGYICYGQALKFVYGEKGWLETKLAKKYQFIRYSLFVLSYILSPFAYFFPNLGAHIIAVKTKITYGEK